jgi:hypothetical protein
LQFYTRLWFSGMTEASQAFNPGSNPGSRILFLCYWRASKMPLF